MFVFIAASGSDDFELDKEFKDSSDEEDIVDLSDAIGKKGGAKKKTLS